MPSNTHPRRRMPTFFKRYAVASLLLISTTCHAPRPEALAVPWSQADIHEQANAHQALLAMQGPFSQLKVGDARLFEVPALQSDNPRSQTETATALFHFVASHMMPWDAPSDTPFADLVYGFGYGLCNDQARWLGELATAAGLRARLVSLPRHRIVEIRADGQHLLFDPQHRCDYSALFNRPTSFADLLQHLEDLPCGRDAIGYDWTYLAQVFTEEMARYKRCGTPPAHPSLALDPGQLLLISPRPSNMTWPLPEIEPQKAIGRSDVLPFFLVHLLDRAGAQPTPFRARIGLPLVGIHTSPKAFASLAIGGKSYRGDVPNDATLLSQAGGSTSSIRGTLTPHARVHLQFALAPWVAERLLNPNLDLQCGTSHTPLPVIRLPTIHRVWVQELRLASTASLHIGRTVPVEITLAWRDLSWMQPHVITLDLDELSSELALECWQTLGTTTFTWQPDIHASTGEARLTIPWHIDYHHNPYRDPSIRTLLARVRGPDLPAGNTHHQLTVTLAPD